MHTTTIGRRLGTLALGLTMALAGVHKTQEVQAQSTTAQGIYGEWKGRWGGGGGKIRITIIESDGATPDVTYCFKRNCFEPEDVALENTVLTFTAAPNLSYRFELSGDRLRTRLKKGARTFRTKMKRVSDGTAPAKRTTPEAGK